ncbi:MAG TPA: hypothetical protein VFK02_10475 [Kofleriaceae bacterium]|nr:hypothetical protein [Kofleriaceae bacterium]
MLTRSSLALVIALAACGGSSSDSSSDAAPPPDTPAPSVMAVTCPATVPLTVDAPDSELRFVFTPATPTIALGDIVKFTTHSEHDVVPDPRATQTDDGLNVDFGTIKCLKFTRTGTFGFKCAPHGFTGAITVQLTN